MAYTEIYRKRSGDYTIVGSLDIDGATGTASVTFHTEMIIYHTTVGGFPSFKGEQYLYVTKVSTPLDIYIGVDGRNQIGAGGYSNKSGSLKDNAKYTISTMGSGAIPISNGDTISVLLSSFDMANNRIPLFTPTRFLDGKTPASASAEVTITLASRLTSSNGYYRLGDPQTISITQDITEYVPIQDKNTIIVAADSFTDEEKNPDFSFSLFTPPGIASNLNDYVKRFDLRNYGDLGYNYVDANYGYQIYYYEDVSMEVGLSLDGENLIVDYRSVPLTKTTYSFELTDAEMDKLRAEAQGNNTLPIYYMVKTTRTLSNANPVLTLELYTKAQRNFTIVDSQPHLNPTVKDVNSDTIALTGNPNIFVRYESAVEFSTGAVASKHATIVSQSVQCGSKIIYDLYNGVISDIESGSFIFNATDSRGLHADQVVVSNTAMIEYVKPTCKQKPTITLSGETGAVITLKLNGNYYNGSFGKKDNTFKLEVRYKSGSEEMGAWETITETPTFNDDNTYELVLTFPDLSYDKDYVFQTRLTDVLNVVETAQESVVLLPLFDWGEEDFNFNIPIKMNKQTVLRHNQQANNTVLSASGGHIYVRPNGTNDTAGEMIINPNGSVNFNGAISAESLTLGSNTLAD